MDQGDMIYPLFAMALLTGMVMLLLFVLRLMAVMSGKIDPHYLERHGAESAPPVIVRLTHNLANLFEFPVLFMLAGIVLIALQNVDRVDVNLAWSYTGLRYLHRMIHITYNKVLHRAGIHFLSDMLLVLIWFRILFQTQGLG